MWLCVPSPAVCSGPITARKLVRGSAGDPVQHTRRAGSPRRRRALIMSADRENIAGISSAQLAHITYGYRLSPVPACARSDLRTV